MPGLSSATIISPNSKIEFGDMIVAELSPGISFQNQHPNLGFGFKGLYNFQFGGVVLAHLHRNFDLQASMSLFKWGTDFFNDFWGGSSYEIKGRHKRIFAEIALVSENHLYTGIFNSNDFNKDDNISKGTLGMAYFILPNKRIGFKSEIMPIFKPYQYKNFGLESVFTTKIYYAINF